MTSNLTQVGRVVKACGFLRMTHVYDANAKIITQPRFYRKELKSQNVQTRILSNAYSDVSNNRTGTAIYFQRKILPIRSY